MGKARLSRRGKGDSAELSRDNEKVSSDTVDTKDLAAEVFEAVQE